LNLLMRTLQSANPPRLQPRGDSPSGDGREEQSEEKSWPHALGPAYFEDVS
jgi:hypothetical protein